MISSLLLDFAPAPMDRVYFLQNSSGSRGLTAILRSR